MTVFFVKQQTGRQGKRVTTRINRLRWVDLENNNREGKTRRKFLESAGRENLKITTKRPFSPIGHNACVTGCEHQ